MSYPKFAVIKAILLEFSKTGVIVAGSDVPEAAIDVKKKQDPVVSIKDTMKRLNESIEKSQKSVGEVVEEISNEQDADQLEKLKKSKQKLESGIKSDMAKLSGFEKQLKKVEEKKGSKNENLELVKERSRILQDLGFADYVMQIKNKDAHLKKLQAKGRELQAKKELLEKQLGSLREGRAEQSDQIQEDILRTEQEVIANAKLQKNTELEIESLKKQNEDQNKAIERLKIFLSKTRNEQLGRKLFGDKFSVAEKSIFDDGEIEKVFRKINESSEYFQENDVQALKLYKEFYKLCYYNWVVIEDNTNPEEVHGYAYKFMAVFLEARKYDNLYNNVDEFISNFCGHIKPMHDLFSAIQFPAYLLEDEERTQAFDLAAWQKLIKEHGLKVLKEFGNAPILGQKEKSREIEPITTLEALNESLKNLKYKNADKHPELAEIFSKYKVVQERFDRAAQLLEDGTLKPKKSDKLPDINFSVTSKVESKDKVESKGRNHENYYFLKLPAGDLRGLILGDVTNSCQSVGGAAEVCAIDGTNLDNNGFYVLIKTKKPLDMEQYKDNPAFRNEFWKNLEDNGGKILGQGYVWRSKYGNLVVDSWENLNPASDDARIESVLKEFALQAMRHDQSIGRVTIGTGGNTPEGLRTAEVPSSDDMLEGRPYGDSEKQSLLGESEVLLEARDKLKTRLLALEITRINHDEYYSISIIENLLKLPDQVLLEVGAHEFCEDITKQYFINDIENLQDFYREVLALPQEKLQLLISDEAQCAYKTGGVKASDLIKLEQEQIEFLISRDAQYAYRNGIQAQDIIPAIVESKEKEKKKEPVADKIIKMKRSLLKLFDKSLDVNDKRLTLDKLNLLISCEAQFVYIAGGVKASNLIGLEQELIELLISYDAQVVYRTGGVKASDLIKLEQAQIELLISRGAQAAYETGGVKASDLIGLEQEQIEFLISYDILHAYRTGGVKASDLIGLKQELIELLISYEAQAVYIDEGVKARNILGLTSDPMMIKNLISPQSLQLYQDGRNLDDVFESFKLKTSLSKPEAKKLEGQGPDVIVPRSRL